MTFQVGNEGTSWILGLWVPFHAQWHSYSLPAAPFSAEARSTFYTQQHWLNLRAATRPHTSHLTQAVLTAPCCKSRSSTCASPCRPSQPGSRAGPAGGRSRRRDSGSSRPFCAQGLRPLARNADTYRREPPGSGPGRCAPPRGTAGIPRPAPSLPPPHGIGNHSNLNSFL